MQGRIQVNHSRGRGGGRGGGDKRKVGSFFGLKEEVSKQVRMFNGRDGIISDANGAGVKYSG